MFPITLQDYSVRFSEHFQLTDINWQLDADQHWAVLGPNGSGKSALAALLAKVGEPLSGSMSGVSDNVAMVSFEAQAELIERERERDDSDLTNEVFEGTPVREILLELAVQPERLQGLVEGFGISEMLDKGFRKLSTGETRKVMLIRALLSEPELMILDEPFDGLDVNSVAMLKQLLHELEDKQPTVLVLNRMDELPDFITHIAYMHESKLIKQIATADKDAMAELHQLLHLKRTDIEIPAGDPATLAPRLDPAEPLVRMKNLRVAYGDEVILSELDWTIEPGQHWQLSGPNGSGKSTLLNLITGDHPQCYANDIFAFGYQRGNGETIWQIKQHIGYVSSSLQWDYRVSISVKKVILSGFFDSIGVYQHCSEIQNQIVDQWLAWLGMEDKANEPFKQLSYGDQRLLLIARAMVKHPKLLILDEPCQGLDDMNRQLILALIEKICQGSEATVLYVNHHQEDAIGEIEKHLVLTKD